MFHPSPVIYQMFTAPSLSLPPYILRWLVLASRPLGVGVCGMEMNKSRLYCCGWVRRGTVNC